MARIRNFLDVEVMYLLFGNLEIGNNRFEMLATKK